MGGPGSGRHRATDKPVGPGLVMRVPTELVGAVQELIRRWRRQRAFLRVARRVGTGNSLKRRRTRRVGRVTDAGTEGFESPATLE